MNTSEHRLAGSAGLLILLLPLAVSAQSTGFLKGVVQDPSAAGGITGAMLQVVDDDSTVVERGFSGEEGAFLLEVLEGGPYVLRVESMGFRGFTSDTFHITAGDTLQLPRMVLLPDPVRSGRPQGAPTELGAVDVARRFVESRADGVHYRWTTIDPPRYAFRPGPGSK